MPNMQPQKKLLAPNPTQKAEQTVHITMEQMKSAFSVRAGRWLNQELVDKVNKIIDDEEFRETYRDNFLSYSTIMQNPRFRISDYIMAVKFISLKLKGNTNIVSYAMTFPDRYQRLIDIDKTPDQIKGHVSAYFQTSLVRQILEQSLVPHYILNQDLYQKALNTQATLMLTAKSEKVRSDAANSILTHLKMPEIAKVQLDVTVKEDDSIAELRRTTMGLVKKQQEMLESGVMNVQEIVELELVTEAEFVK